MASLAGKRSELNAFPARQASGVSERTKSSTVLPDMFALSQVNSDYVALEETPDLTQQLTRGGFIVCPPQHYSQAGRVTSRAGCIDEIVHSTECSTDGYNSQIPRQDK